MKLAILIVGGYGTFGARLVDLLDQDERLTLIVAGRSQEKARDFCYSRLRSRAHLRAVRLDRDGDVDGVLEDLKPDVVVDCSGPFQVYGERPYHLLEACIARGVHYLDLADGSDFVAGVAAFDEAARAKNVFVLSGASSFPVLTAAAVRALSTDMAQITAIRGGIAPSPFAVVGENVIRAIASYAGQTTTLRRRGNETTAYPLTEQMRAVISPPGYLPLESRLFSLVDVPDLRALPLIWPEVRDVWMGAAPVPEILHRALIVCARLVRAGVVPTLAPMARLMHWATNHFRWGDHRGGMFVAVEGRDAAGAARKRAWYLLAEGEDGPLIPSMAVAAIVRKMLRGENPAPGARAAVRELEIADYNELFADRTIYTGVRNEMPGAPLYQRILGSAWDELPEPARALHLARSAKGRAKVTRGNFLARLVADIVGFPKASADTPISVRFETRDGVETWTRTFGSKSFSSVQSEGGGRGAHLLYERFGPILFAMALVRDGDKLRMILRRWRVFKIPLPLWLGPRADAYETVADGRFRFHVDIRHPLIGRIIRYEGWLEPEKT